MSHASFLMDTAAVRGALGAAATCRCSCSNSQNAVDSCVRKKLRRRDCRLVSCSCFTYCRLCSKAQIRCWRVPVARQLWRNRGALAVDTRRKMLKLQQHPAKAAARPPGKQNPAGACLFYYRAPVCGDICSLFNFLQHLLGNTLPSLLPLEVATPRTLLPRRLQAASHMVALMQSLHPAAAASAFARVLLNIAQRQLHRHAVLSSSVSESPRSAADNCDTFSLSSASSSSSLASSAI